jgi:hypothetical protein
MKVPILYGYKENTLISKGLQHATCHLRSDGPMEMSLNICCSVLWLMFTDVPKDRSASVFRAQTRGSLVVTIKINVFWYLTPYNLVNIYLCFEWMRCLHLQELKGNILMAMTSEY